MSCNFISSHSEVRLGCGKILSQVFNNSFQTKLQENTDGHCRRLMLLHAPSTRVASSTAALTKGTTAKAT